MSRETEESEDDTETEVGNFLQVVRLRVFVFKEKERTGEGDSNCREEDRSPLGSFNSLKRIQSQITKFVS
jgi:hypothetical protein